MTETVESKRKFINRNVTVTEMNLGTDKRGKAFANLRVETVARSGPKKDQTISIFAQVFGDSFEKLKAKLAVGAQLAVYGVHQTLQPSEGVAGCTSYVIYGERAPRMVAAPEALAA
jgi:hypothetical protein